MAQQQRAKTSSQLLQEFTRDASYVSKMQAVEEAPHGREWDNRFTTSKIPLYDAVNDRFCKFTMRRRAPSANKKGVPPPQHPQMAWAGDKQQPLKAAGDRLPALRFAPGQGGPAGGAGGGGLGGAGGALLDPLQKTFPGAGGVGGGGANAMKEDASSAPNQSVEVLFAKGKQRILKLWDELGVPEPQRISFAQQAMSLPTTENVQAINDQIQRLLDRRNFAIQVEKNIEVREGFLYLLQELAERYASELVDKDRALRELQSLVRPLRTASLDVVEAVVRWRETSRSPTSNTTPVFLWKGVSYVNKMATDLFFLIHTRLGLLLDFEVKNNPLLDPRKQVELTAAAGKLAPIRRLKESKDLPKERLDAAEKILIEELQRQTTLHTLRAAGGGEGDNSDFLHADEETHLAALAAEESEHQQLIVEEDAWLRQQQLEAESHDVQFHAATKIQSVYRAYVARKVVGAKIRQRLAAIKIQTLGRQFIAKLRVQRRRREVQAAKKLQALQRGVGTRSRIQEIKFRHLCATHIQRIFRGHVARRYTDMLNFLRHCARKIQATWRSYRDRRGIRSMVDQRRNGASTRIQAAWRGFAVRHNPLYSPLRIKMSVRLQAWTRGTLHRKFVRQLLVQRRAAVRLQSWYRMLLAKAEANRRRQAKVDVSWVNHLRAAVAAATKIQSVARMVAARLRVVALRNTRISAIREQVNLQEQLNREAAERLQRIRSDAATTVQSLVRGHRGRMQARMIRNLHFFATQMQKVVRGFLGRRYCLGQRDRLAASITASLAKAAAPAAAAEEPSPMSLIAESVRAMARGDATDATPEVSKISTVEDRVEPTHQQQQQQAEEERDTTTTIDDDRSSSKIHPTDILSALVVDSRTDATDMSEAPDASLIAHEEEPAMLPASTKASPQCATEADKSSQVESAPSKKESVPRVEELEAQEQADRLATAAADRKAQEEAERKAKEAADRQAKEEADRKAKEDADRKAKDEADRQAKEEADRQATEQAAAVQAERTAQKAEVSTDEETENPIDIEKHCDQQVVAFAATTITRAAHKFLSRSKIRKANLPAMRKAIESDAHATAARLQQSLLDEAVYAARMIQRAMRRVLAKKRRPSSSSGKKKKVSFGSDLKAPETAQECEFAVAMIQRVARASLARRRTRQSKAPAAAAASSSKLDAAAAVAQEKEMAVRMIQHVVRRSPSPTAGPIAAHPVAKATTAPAPEDPAKEPRHRWAAEAQVRHFAATTVQRFVKLALSRASLRVRYAVVRPTPPPTDEQEKGYAATMIQQLAHRHVLRPFRRQQRAAQAETTLRNAARDAATRAQERQCATVKIQRVVPRTVAAAQRRRAATTAAAAAVSQEAAYAATKIRSVCKMHLAKLKVQDLRTAALVKAVLQSTPEQPPASSTPAHAPEATAAPVAAAVLLQPQPSKKHVRFSVDATAQPERKMSSLPKEAELATEKTELLSQKVAQLEEEIQQLRQTTVSPAAAAASESPAPRDDARAAEVVAAEAAERQAKKVADRQAKAEAERNAAEEAASVAQAEAERTTKAEADRKAKEEADLQAKVEADRLAKEAADRQAQEEAAHKAQEEADRVAKEEADRAAAALRAKQKAEQLSFEDTQRKLRALEQQEADAAERRRNEAIRRANAEKQRADQILAEKEAARALAEALEAARPAAAKTTSVAEVVCVVQACFQAVMSADIVLYWKRKSLEAQLRAKRFAAARRIQCAMRQKLARLKIARVRTARAEALAKKNFALTLSAEADEKAQQQQRLNEQITYQIARTNEAEAEKRAAEVRRQQAVQLLHRSALRIQCAVRCYNAKFMYQWKLKDRHDKLRARERADYAVISQKAAVKVQCAVRCFVAKRKVARKREDKHRAKDEKRRMEAHRHASAIRIQCMYRSFNARFEAGWRREDRRRANALALDKKREEENDAVRAVVEKEELRKKMLRQRAAAITMQCAWRCYNAKFELMWRVEARAKRAAEIAARRQGAVLAKIATRVGRGYLDRRKLHLDRMMARNLAAQELLLAEYEADSVINQVLDAEK